MNERVTLESVLVFVLLCAKRKKKLRIIFICYLATDANHSQNTSFHWQDQNAVGFQIVYRRSHDPNSLGISQRIYKNSNTRPSTQEYKQWNHLQEARDIRVAIAPQCRIINVQNKSLAPLLSVVVIFPLDVKVKFCQLFKFSFSKKIFKCVYQT